MAVRVDIISIGTLSRNRRWGETSAVRTAHATTTLLRTRDTGGPRVILVDPGLPTPIQAARLGERAGIMPSQVDTVFLTNFRPAHRAGLSAYSGAQILLHEAERDAVDQHLQALLERANGDQELVNTLHQELELLGRTQAAEDRLAAQIDLFPLPGYTPGTCGLLIAEPASTTLIAGDAVPTRDHLLAGQILPDAVDVSVAQQSMREAYEIADVIIPGHDNLFVNPRSW